MRTRENSTRRMPMFLLLVACLLALFLSVALYLYYSPGKGNLIDKPSGAGNSHVERPQPSRLGPVRT